VNWAEYVASWSQPPVDDLGYFKSEDMLAWSDFRLMDAIEGMRRARYEGSRNHGGLWRKLMGLDLTGRTVLEYGCGVGMEAAELAGAGNNVVIADISESNMDLATRVMALTGAGRPTNRLRIGPDWPFIMSPPAAFHTVNCSGVLHHIRKARLTMERFHEVLKPGGELRLMVYSDEAWRIYTKTEPPGEPDIEDHPKFQHYIDCMDGVGDYATWYDQAKIERLFGDLFEIDEYAYLTPDRRYCAAVLIRKDIP